MEDKRIQQKEALESLVEFNERILKNMNIIVKELSGERLDDTDNFLNGIIEGMNWEIEVLNGTLDFLNEEKERINKDAFDAACVRLSKAVKAKDDQSMAAAFTELIPLFENLGNAAKEVVA